MRKKAKSEFVKNAEPKFDEATPLINPASFLDGGQRIRLVTGWSGSWITKFKMQKLKCPDFIEDSRRNRSKINVSDNSASGIVTFPNF
ncbi:MAG: hypothetical protein A3C81_02640 [Candidatus Yanofskybacteria bacterium RIFCSPHIGHO2_02_FULL_46_19]|uniref:Uncharacterized protein n=2 Tax=Candidatus Yanofskyibacteriota TaxID=1752733 RepID=A0A1F8H497_9BACT|nr:MAG: hypothetical protein A3C81_02640 [Candidatus Yanofskybacteria bacterium RIFCSPHIGHO2_02_FULL_46_19]OGN27004.1 MAG: hypothetical protein A3B17_03190 [Candidatus Yanofskybacteria bacterium RIFCSPLOWO2_01_FULL_45_72]OGN32413.1 MAG: hypothetical protein A3J01_00640 [Candidatus Yanofskybacteria bacterium RIFCSPLOWO2_02_FULL_45_18]